MRNRRDFPGYWRWKAPRASEKRKIHQRGGRSNPLRNQLSERPVRHDKVSSSLAHDKYTLPIQRQKQPIPITHTYAYIRMYNIYRIYDMSCNRDKSAESWLAMHHNLYITRMYNTSWPKLFPFCSLVRLTSTRIFDRFKRIGLFSSTLFVQCRLYFCQSVSTSFCQCVCVCVFCYFTWGFSRNNTVHISII